MKKEQTKVYVLMLSKEFPKEHPKAGEQTGFKEKLELALKAQEQAEECATCGDCKTCYCPSASGIMKVHTIRTNMERWSGIMQKVQEGKAVISVRQWKGRPYEKGNVQVELFRLDKDDGVGLQTLSVMEYTDADDGIERAVYCIDGKPMPMLTLKQIAENDGLTVEDWKAWFTGMTFDKPLPIIHFTKFRY
uniref:hypothetical protein n=1 Tax=Bacteroides xylanisolvens TaxID=371601 RepID=UPI0040284861